MKFRVVLLILSLQFLSCDISGSTNPNPLPPTASTISLAFTGYSGTCQVTATWTECPDSDFSKYELFRSTSPNIQTDPSAATLVCTNTSSVLVTCIDNDVTWETPYYYAIRTSDSDSLTAWSNEAGITTPSEGAVPTPSVLSVEFTGASGKLSLAGSIEVCNDEDRAIETGSGISMRSRVTGKGFCEVTATWTQCPDVDFSSYILYRSESSNISQDTTIAVNLGTFANVDDTLFVDNTVSWETTYYYALSTMNTGANRAWSNEESITTHWTN